MAEKETRTSDLADENSFGAKLLVAMKSSGDTKSSLARKSGLSEAAIRGYLKDESSPSIVQLMKIAKATGMSAAWFLGEENDPVASNSIEDDVALLTMLFRNLTAAQRRLVMTQVLSALSSQFASSSVEQLKSLSPSVIDIALQISALPAEKLQSLQVELGIGTSLKL